MEGYNEKQTKDVFEVGILVSYMLCCDLFVCVFAGNEAAIELEKRVKALEERLNKLENKDLNGDFCSAKINKNLEIK